MAWTRYVVSIIGGKRLLRLSGLVSKTVKTNNVTTCHSERSVSEVEESTHYDTICSQIGAKILRLATLAQDDMVVGLSVFTAGCLKPIA